MQKNQNISTKEEQGFSLMEMLVYIAVLAVSSVFLIAVFTSVTRLQLRQALMNEVNHQVSFISNVIERLVHESSLIGLDAGLATSSLILRMASSTFDPTKIYISGEALYLQEGNNTPMMLTDAKVKAENFSVTKFENIGGRAGVEFSLVLSYNTEDPKSEFSRAIQGVVTRISAANFDSHLVPNASNNYDIGNSIYNWRNAYFAGNIGIGTVPSSAAKIKTSGDIAFSNSSAGIVFMPPSGGINCFRLSITDSGGLTTTTVPCP